MSASPDQLYRVMDSVVVPLVEADGGELFVVELSPTRVLLHVRGSFAGCPGNALAIRNVIEPALRRASGPAAIAIGTGELLPQGAVPWAEFRLRPEARA